MLSLHVNTETELLSFDETGTKLFIKRTALEIISDKEIAWSGAIYSSRSGEEVGDVTFIQHKENGITGTIDIEGNFYDIRYLGNSGLHAIRTVDKESLKNNSQIKKRTVSTAQLNKDYDKQKHTRKSINLVTNSSSSISRCSPEYQTLLVLYTPSAQQAVTDINSIITLARQEANEAYINSEIFNMRLIVAHTQLYNFSESNRIRDDLNLFLNDINVQNLRNQHKADAVILLTDGNYQSGNTVLFGEAKGLLATDTTAYAIVEADKATGPNYVFAHEMGHLQGAQHHPNDVTTPNGPFSFGYGHRFSYKPSIFVSRRYRSTIMAGECSLSDPSCTFQTYSKRKHFSNPDVEYNGEDTGISGQRNNGLAIRSTAATIADLRNPNELKASIDITSGNPTPGYYYTFASNTCGGQSSLTYEWRKSFNDPFSYGGIEGTGSTFAAILSPGYHYIKLTVKSGTTQIAESYRYIHVEEVNGCPPGQICDPGGPDGPNKLNINTDSEKKPTEFEFFSAYPNPFNPSTSIAFKLAKTEIVKLSVYNTLGKEVAVLVNRTLGIGSHQYSFNADNLSSGVYIVRLQLGNRIESQTITLLK